MKILDHTQIKQKINRLAFQIAEQNLGEKIVILAGINNNGMRFAKLLKAKLEEINKFELVLCQLKLNPANPLDEVVELDIEINSCRKKTIIIVDDVANTGRTIFYAIKPFLGILPKKVEVAVLVDRKHKSFPIKVDYVGISLATTLMDNINVKLLEEEEYAAFLE